MDPLPQIPQSGAVNDAVGPIRDVFERELEQEGFPIELANNIRTYSVDDNLSLKEAAKNTLEIQRCLEEESEIVSGAEFAILQQHGDHIVHQGATAKNEFLREMMRLKFCDIFPSVCLPDKLKYGLLEKCDLYPDVTRQFLDFRFNAGRHQCHRCFPKVDIKPARADNVPKAIRSALQLPPPQPALLLVPPRLEFRNFELHRSYQRTFWIRNVSARVQKVSVSARPRLAEVFQLDFEPCRQLAPGMCLRGAVRFTPAYFANLQDTACFVSGTGETFILAIQSRRDPPKLLGFVSKAGGCARPGSVRLPGSRHFSSRRQNAVNSTIDCGSCFCAEHVLLSLVLANHGNTARFFWLTEEEFCCQDVSTVSKTLELKSGPFWIYPSFFEMPPGDICEVSMLFQPLQGGFHAQTLFLMCDNNTYRQIELIGDAVRFNKNIVSVGIPYYATELQDKPGHRVFLGHLGPHEARQFTLSISNRCSLSLNYGLTFRPEASMRVSSNSATPYLAPYSVTDITLECACLANVPEGYYSSAVQLFVRDVPIASLEGEEKFLISTRGAPFEPVDVLVMEVEVVCFLDLQGVPVTECGQTQGSSPPLPMADLEFDRPFLDFGVLPVGADVSKAFSIRNVGVQELRWRIAELEYHVDGRPYVEPLPEPHLRPNQGRLEPGHEQRLVYAVVGRAAGRRASILVLFSVPPLVAQSVCVVTCEVVALSMRITTGQSPEAILCPMRMLYSGVPVELAFKLHNDSPISGPFYFMAALGSDADKVRAVYSPQAGELKPGSTRTIRLTLTCFEVGILENVLLPCFIGKGQRPLELRLLCAVDCVHVFFYLPGSKGDFQKILWPPKVVYEYGTEWSSYCLCGEEERENQSSCTLRQTLSRLSQNEDSDGHGLLTALVSADSEIFLQDCVMQVHGLPTKEPRKVTIYLENVTPKSAKYCVQSTNYSCCKGGLFPPKSYRLRPEQLWDDLIQKHGLLVQPEMTTGLMGPNELVAVHIWIYAATWGIYAEELVVDIEAIAPFSFSLIVEAVGSPLVLPLAPGAITRYPTIRLGAIAMDSADVTRDLVLRNTSSIEVAVAWHVFLRQEEAAPFNLVCDAALDQFELTFTDQFLGVQASEALEVQPSKVEAAPGAQLSLLIVLKPPALSPTDEQRAVSWFLLGRIFPNQEDRLKPGYLLRKPATLIVEVTATLVRPQLQVELMETPLRLYANEVALRRRSDFSIRCLLRNPTPSVQEVELECLEPLSLGVKVVVGPHKCKEIELPCLLSQEKILKWAASVYRPPETKGFSLPRDSIGAAEMRLQPGDEKTVEEEHKVLTLHRKLFVYFQGGAKKVVPLDVMIYYPHITVKPVHVKFGYVLLGRTQKTLVTIFNLTGYEVLFEIYKTVATQEIFVTPSNGQIEKSVGQNHSFANVSVFFTPTECRTYHESIRIVTNIPHYYIDVPIKGAGSFNEKFE